MTAILTHAEFSLAKRPFVADDILSQGELVYQINGARVEQSALWTLALTVVGIIASVGALCALILQLRLLSSQVEQARLATDRDHERRRKQATLEFVSTSLNNRRPPGQPNLLPRSRDAAAVAATIEKALAGDETLSWAITDNLDNLENLAVGVHHDIYDIAVVDSQLGGRVIASAENYRPWTNVRRKISGNKLYAELDWLADELRIRRQNAPRSRNEQDAFLEISTK